MKNKLPEGWKEVELGDIFDFQKKSNIKAGDNQKEGRYKFFTSSDIQSKFIDKAVFDGEYLIFSTGGSAGVHYCNEKFSTSTDCFVVKIDNKLISKYVYYYLFTNIHILEAGFKGAGLKHISKEYLKRIKIIYPEKKESQQKIVSILEKAEQAKKMRKTADELTKDFLKAVFVEMFGDYKNTKKWKISKLEEQIIFMTSGSRGWAEYYVNQGSIFIRIQNVKNSKLILDDVQYVDAPKTKESLRTKVKEGDLLISITADLGRTAVVDKKTAEHGAYINQHIALLRLKNSLNALYCSFFLESEMGKKQFAKFDQEGVKSGLSFNSVKSIQVFLPPIAIQNKFSSIVKEIETIKEQQKNSKEQIDNLFNVLMQKAFKGELVP